MLLRSVLPLFSLFTSCYCQEAAQSIANDIQDLASLKSIIIYDSVSPAYPFELRERGTAYYSPTNTTGTFSDAGIHSRPLDAVSSIYRIGTEDFLVAVKVPKDILQHTKALDEVLKLHLDLDGEVFHAAYSVVKAVSQQGTFDIQVDSAARHMGPDVKLQKRVIKTKPAQDGTGAVVEEEDDVPEKTFIQKYWIYAIPLVLLLVLGGGGEQS